MASGAIHFSGRRACMGIEAGKNTFTHFIFASCSFRHVFFVMSNLKWMPLINLHLLCARNQGLCKCLWRAQSHKSSPHYSQTAGCFVQPNHGGCTVWRQNRWKPHSTRFPACKGVHNSMQATETCRQSNTWSSHQWYYNRRWWVPFSGEEKLPIIRSNTTMASFFNQLHPALANLWMAWEK